MPPQPQPTPAQAPPIEVKGLVTTFGETVVHDGLDLVMRRGEILGVVGGSGAGKSVLLSTLIGLKRPEAGEVRILGYDLARASAAELREIKSRWGVLFQSNALFSNLTVRENISAPMYEHTALSAKEIYSIAELKAVLAGLPREAVDQRPAELSGGMQKRAGVARAIALDPELLLMDEPTAGLDPVVAAQVDQLVLQLARTLGMSVLLITHDLDTLYTVCDRIAVLADKKVAAIAPIAELERSEHPWIRRYFGGPRGIAAADAHKRRLIEPDENVSKKARSQ